MDVILNSFKKDFICDIVSEGNYNEVGDYIPGTSKTILFKGAMLPLSERDMKFLPDGVYGISDQKLYTDIALLDNTEIKDIQTKEEYTVYAFKGYNIIDPDFKRYFMKRIDDING